MKISDFNPAVDKKILVFLAGFMWCGIGILLISFAISWLSHYQHTLIFYFVGFFLALPIHFFGFQNIADKNLKRLLPLTSKRCVFSFMTWRSYIIVLIMVSMGSALRHSAIPKNYLSILYNGIGFALFLSGSKYFRFFFRLLQVKTSNT